MYDAIRTPRFALAAVSPFGNAAPALVPPPGLEPPVLTAIFLVSGTIVVVLLLGYFLRHDRCGRPPEPERGIAFVVARDGARGRIYALAPKIMLVAREEEFLSRILARRSTKSDADQEAKKLLAEAVPLGLWARFVEASSLADENPEQAHKNLDALSPAVEEAIRGLVSAGELLRAPENERDP